MASLMNSTEYLKNNNKFNQFVKKIKGRRGYFPIHFMSTALLSYQNQTEILQEN